MDLQALWWISLALSILAWGLVASRYVWPALRSLPRSDGLRPLLLLHSFRFVGLSFLVPGVVSPDLPAAFARPAAYGDFTSALLALIALGLLRGRLGIPVVWLFNLVGSADLLYAFYLGDRAGIALAPGQLGAAFYVVTLLVPLIIVTQGLVFLLLVRRSTGLPPVRSSAA